MKYFGHMLFALCALSFAACDNTETYAEQKEREQNIISAFIEADTHIEALDEKICHVGRITVIDEDAFLNDTVTRCVYDSVKSEYVANEYVKLNTGVYMQIVRRGEGEMLTEGKSKQIVTRYFESNMATATTTSRNTSTDYHRFPDILDVANNYGTFQGSFNTSLYGGGAMYIAYASTAVPEGWLIPLRYIRIGHQTKPDGGIARVRLIIPHSLGQVNATTNVQPYFYEITYEAMN